MYRIACMAATRPTKEAIIEAIRREAAALGGHVGLRAFQRRTGIGDKQFLGVYWATWNDALVEAGINTQSFDRAPTDEASLLEAVATLVGRLDKWPTENEFSLERRRDPTFPSLKAIRRLSRAGVLESKLVAFCTKQPELTAVGSIAATRLHTRETTQLATDMPVEGYVYMMRSGKRYKIGHTTSPSRRHREVRLDLPDPTLLVHTYATDDPRGMEQYWHRRFEAKRVRDTEFFVLSASDIAAFKRHK
jgi:Meiotically up-regulated gene 113